MMMSSAEIVKNRVKAARLARGWSQDELAHRSGLSRSGISAIEIERLVPSAAAALALAKALHCRVEDLFSLDDSAEANTVWAAPPREVAAAIGKPRWGAGRCSIRPTHWRT